MAKEIYEKCSKTELDEPPIKSEPMIMPLDTSANNQANHGHNILIIGEPIIDTTTPICLPYKTRTVRRRIEPIVYQILNYKSKNGDKIITGGPKPGGVFYLARFLRYFSNTTAIYPISEEGNTLLHDFIRYHTKKNKTEQEIINNPPITCWSVPTYREIYKANRFIEVKDVEFESPNWAQGHAFIRLDSGSIDPMATDEVDLVVENIKQHLNSKDRFGCIILADYDLGLFTKHFIEKIKKCIKECNYTDIPVVVYSGRRMRKFQILENCWIVADLSEVSDELADLGADPDPKEKQSSFQFGEIVKKYRKFKGLVVVGGRKTAMATWECKDGKAYIKKTYERNDGGTYKIPLGHRGLIACYLGLQLAKGGDIMSILPMAHKISAYNGSILIDEFDLENAKEIISEEMNSNVPDVDIEYEEIELKKNAKKT